MPACAPPLPPPGQVNLGSLQQQLAALQLQTGTERISPTLDHILELLDEAPAEGAAAEADEFVRQVAETGGAPGCAALPPAAGGQDDEEAGGADAGEASMEGVVAEYAYEAPLPLGDAGAGRGWCGGGAGSWLQRTPPFKPAALPCNLLLLCALGGDAFGIPLPAAACR